MSGLEVLSFQTLILKFFKIFTMKPIPGFFTASYHNLSE
jgi:hypothetical protein